MKAFARPASSKTVISHGQRSWRIKTPKTEAFITCLGGHLAPVHFRLGDTIISPFEVAPWANENLPADTTPVLKPLRGDFFCLPFGGNSKAVRGRQYPVHGETACDKWMLEYLEQAPDSASVTLKRPLKISGGEVIKRVELRAGETNVYQRHTIAGVSGSMPIGHHPILTFPDEPGAAYISTSRFVWGQVYPEPTELPEQRGYSALKPGAMFTSLKKVPTIFGTTSDLSRYPARRGYEDIVLLASDRSLPFAWTAVAFPSLGYVWFGLKDPRVLASTLFWISNGGRHYAPWSGRHVNAMGLEEITGYFHAGIANSIKTNSLNRRGIPTACRLSRKRPLVVNYIMGVAPISSRFTHVKQIKPTAGGVTIQSQSGEQVFAAVDLGFLQQPS